jgi:hypothetical protein
MISEKVASGVALAVVKDLSESGAPFLVVKCDGSPIMEAQRIDTDISGLAWDQFPVPTRERLSERAGLTGRSPAVHVKGRSTPVSVSIEQESQ